MVYQNTQRGYLTLYVGSSGHWESAKGIWKKYMGQTNCWSARNQYFPLNDNVVKVSVQ